jgi:hypothetical protein
MYLHQTLIYNKQKQKTNQHEQTLRKIDDVSTGVAYCVEVGVPW